MMYCFCYLLLNEQLLYPKDIFATRTGSAFAPDAAAIHTHR